MALIEQTGVGYLRKHYSLLKGALIMDVKIETISMDDDVDWVEYWPSLKVRLPDGKTFWVTVDCDPEGNGPGHLSGWSVL